MTPTPIKCPECGLANWSTDPNCKRCKFVFQPEASGAIGMPSQPLPEASFADLYEPDYDGGIIPSHSQTPQMIARMAAARQAAKQDNRYDQFLTPKAQMPQMPPENPVKPVFRENNQRQQFNQPVYSKSSVKLKSGAAIASMILGIVGFLTAIFLVGFVFAFIGLILGIVALVKVSKKPMMYGGKGFAVAGVVLSALTVLALPVIAAIAIPNLLAARRAANEGSAISSIRTLSAVEASYMATTSSSKCADLKELGAANSIDSVLAGGEKMGYRYQVVNSPFGGCEITATPMSVSIGTRSFYFSTEDGILRAGKKNGQRADKNDAPLN